MPAFKKTDNTSLASKLAIRRWLLGRMGVTQVDVLDTCAGVGHIWHAMKQHVTVRRWVRCDVKPRQAGTLKMTATDAVRSLPLADFNVIDIDPYGDPWEAYLAMLPRLMRPTAVFLTRGHAGVSRVALATISAAGIPTSWEPKLPRTPLLGEFLANRVLGHACRFTRVDHAGRIGFQNVTYYALGLAPLSAKERRRG